MEKCPVCDKEFKYAFAKEQHINLMKDDAHKAYREQIVNSNSQQTQQSDPTISYSDVMLSERKQEQIRQLFEKGENISDIARKVNADRKTVRLYIDKKYTTQEPQKSDQIMEGRQDATVQDTSEKEVEVTVQPLFQYSPDDLERAKEILMNEKKDEIIKEFWENTVGPLFAKGQYLTGDRHGEIIKILMEKHQNKIYKLNKGYQQEKTNFTYKIQTLRNGNLELKEINGELHDYIGNYLDDAGRLEWKILEEERGGFIVENTRFEQYVREKQTYFRGIEEDLSNKFREAGAKLKEAVKQKEEQDEREKGLNMLKNETIEQKNKCKELASHAERTLSDIKWRQKFLNETLETARKEKLKIPNFPPQSKEENKKQLQSEEERDKMIMDAIGPKTVKLVPA